MSGASNLKSINSTTTVPSWAAAGLQIADSLEVRALLAERRQRVGYERESQAAIATC